MEKKPENVAVYCRVSTQLQSTDRQEAELLEYASNKGYNINPKYIYKDIISGYSLAEERPQYDMLFDAIKRGEVKIVLFSELTRLGRNSIELLQEIERLKELDVELHFKSQNLIINAKQDLGSRILLAILAVTATYEIELFSERSLSGKIKKIKMGGGVGGDNNAYGYKNDINKKMTIREDEAKIVKRIFEEYAAGRSTLEISDSLNADKIPTAYTTRVIEFRKRREERGQNRKEYKKFDPDNIKWSSSMIARMLCRELYTGKRHIIFHKPNPTEKNKRNKKREIAFEYNEYCENLRIISDELFAMVQQRLSNAIYNKNNSIKHENLLKEKIACGECGANYTVGKSTNGEKQYPNKERTYRCYGKIKRIEKPSTCVNGAEIRQWRLDGLVLTLSLRMFAEIDLEENNRKRIERLRIEIEHAKKIVSQKELRLKEEEDEYKLMMSRYARAKNKAVESLIDDATEKYEKNFRELQSEIVKQNKLITTNTITIERIKNLTKGYTNINNKMDQIRNSKGLVKSMIDEYIDKIYIYRINNLWNLIVVKYNNGVEFWGTIKSSRYKNSEMFYDELLCKYGVEFNTWIINNTERCFDYDKENHLFTYNGNSSIYTNLSRGTYTYDEFDEMLHKAEWIGSYSLFDYEFGSTNIKIEEREKNENDYIDWGKHNNEVLKRLKNREKKE